MLIFETHAHFDDEQFDEDRDELIGSLPAHGIAPAINVGASLNGSKRSIELAGRYPYIYAAIGVHPEDINELDEEGLQWLKENSSLDKVVSIGEIGLDYYWEKEEDKRALQREWFRRQIDMAIDVDLPVIIHSRDACEDTLDIIKEAVDKGSRGVMHCFSYSPEIAAEYVKMGYYIGVGGVVTFKNGRKLKETVEKIPLSKIVVETDCPYMAPAPFRGRRNDSTYLPYIVKEIARIKEITEEEVIEETANNARELFQKAVYR